MYIFVYILLLQILTIFAYQPCQPFAPRIFYGNILVDITSNQFGKIYFNTIQQCSASYVMILTSKGFSKGNCKTIAIQTTNISNYFKPYVHQCVLQGIQFNKQFLYTVYGWDKKQQQIPYKQQWIQATLNDPRPNNQNVKLIITADWSTLQDLPYIPITKSLKQTYFRERASALMVIGDIAYDLHTDNGAMYIKFLQMISQISTVIPFILITGNHQRQTIDSFNLLSGSFQTYDLTDKMATGLNFGSLYLINYDNYDYLYGGKSKDATLSSLRNQLEKGKQSGRQMISFCHYPLQCSSDGRCHDIFQIAGQYFDSLLQYGVTFSFGAHSHIYQRLYPYYRNRTFKQLESPYYKNQSYLISLLQGAAGNHEDLVARLQKQEYYTASYTVNQTGFGILRSSEKQISFSHLSTKRGIVDDILLIKSN